MENKKKKSKILILVVAVLAIYFGYHIVKNLKYRMGSKPVSVEQAGDQALENLQNDAEELGFEEAQKRAQERGNAKLNNLKGNDKVVAAAIGFLSIEYKLAEGYEIYCKNHGLAQMPNMKKYTYNLNKSVHNKALKLLEAAGITQTDVENNMLMPLEPQLLQAIDMELSSIVGPDQTIKSVCEELENTAADNKTLEVKLQNANIVEIIENN